jgi:hypothetical protein
MVSACLVAPTPWSFAGAVMLTNSAYTAGDPHQGGQSFSPGCAHLPVVGMQQATHNHLLEIGTSLANILMLF